MPTPLSLQAAGTLGSLNIGAAAAAAAIVPLLAQVDLLLGADFGLGSLKADLAAQYTAALQLSATITDPQLQMLTALNAALQAVAQIQGAIDAGLVLPSFQVNAGAQLQLLAALQVKLGAINLLIEAALGVKSAQLAFLTNLRAALDAGPAALYAATGQDLQALLSQISSHNYGDAGFGAGDQVTGILILSKAPSFHAGASVLFPLPPP